MNKRFAYSAAALASAVAMISAPAAAQDANKCAALANLTIASTEVGLPNGGVRIASAERAAVDADLGRPGGDTREYCKVLGAILPVDPAAPPVNFEVNLPLQWNGKALQYGGGGTNGVLITGLAQGGDIPRLAGVGHADHCNARAGWRVGLALGRDVHTG